MSIKAFVVLALVAVAAAATAPLLSADSASAIPGSYIVVFKNSVSKAARDAHVRRVRGSSGGVTVSERNRFQINDFGGYSGKFSNETLFFVRNQPEVAFVEADQTVSIGCTVQTGATWGINRISVDGQIGNGLDGRYIYPPGSGAGVTSYIIDTGIYIEHAELAGRAIWGVNYVDTQNQDCNGHGTHVAGTVAGTAYGVAKKAEVVAVKVLNCAGSGSYAGVISGIDWTANDHIAKKNKATANMSLGGSFSAATNAAVKAAVEAGVTFAIAAGNSDANACNYSPASEPLAITVGATDIGAEGAAQVDIRSSFSNFGTCVDIFAPGSDITSAWIGGTTAIRTISGTSMAAPHVCGVATLILEANPTFTPAQVETAMHAVALNGLIDLQCGTDAVCNQSPNRMLYSQCE